MNFRRVQTLTSIVIFFLVFLFSWYTTGFNIFDIQLSHLGFGVKFSFLWNSMLMVIAMTTFFNVYSYITEHKRLVYKDGLIITFWFVFLNLFLTGLVTMKHYFHDVTAIVYFFSLPLVIFVMAHLNRKHILYDEWLKHTIYSVLMIVLPLSAIHLFKGMAISELIHTIILMVWSVWILEIKNKQ